MVKQSVLVSSVVLAVRCILGGTFIFSSLTKLLHRAEFIDLVSNYSIIPKAISHTFGLVFPWVELVIGCLLVLGIFLRLASSLSIILITGFIVTNAFALTQDNSCGCFGQTIYLSHQEALIIDIIMLAMAIIPLFFKGSSIKGRL